MANGIVFLVVVSLTVALIIVEENVLTHHPVVHSRMTFLRKFATFIEVGPIPKGVVNIIRSIIHCGVEI